jgi:hypothetical protein
MCIYKGVHFHQSLSKTLYLILIWTIAFPPFVLISFYSKKKFYRNKMIKWGNLILIWIECSFSGHSRNTQMGVYCIPKYVYTIVVIYCM